MFFGVPSQRYWSRGADNAFITRSNDLFRALDGGIVFSEYRKLYGDTTPSGITLDDLRTLIKNDLVGGTADINVVDYFTNPESLNAFGESGYSLDESYEDDVDDDVVSSILQSSIETAALEEYLRGLQQRFVPFRRYHTITSERDIIWNGLMSSENATYNAVDVTYFDEHGGSAVGSELFKAHWSTPDYKTRIMPLPPYPNCKGYQMAMRYGMGQIIHNMKDMYRGEILLLGNSRIRPWDICIMQDSYNDIVGPVEVEQVVDTFTFETGYITEIKPSAVVIANEISSWPVLEAMKVACLAVRDIEETYTGLRERDLGSVDNIANWVFASARTMGQGPSDEWIAAMNRRKKDLFGDDFNPGEELYGGDPPLQEDTLGDFADGVGTAITVAGTALAIAGGAVAYKAGGAIVGVLGANAVWARLGGITAVGAGLLVVGGANAAAKNFFDTTSLVWLLGGSILLLAALRGDSVMLIPLMKNGYPIVSGLNTHDPSMLWNNFKGNLGRAADDLVTGSRDMLELWSSYGTHAWRRIPDGSGVGNRGLLRRGFDDAQGVVDLTGQPL